VAEATASRPIKRRSNRSGLHAAAILAACGSEMRPTLDSAWAKAASKLSRAFSHARSETASAISGVVRLGSNSRWEHKDRNALTRGTDASRSSCRR
jgi:hypothetical protein